MEKKLQEHEYYQRILTLLEKIDRQRIEANAKLEAIKNALPNMRALSGWGSGPRAFVEKLQSIIDAQGR